MFLAAINKHSTQLLLLHRPRLSHVTGAPVSSDMSAKVAFRAAANITRIAHDLMTYASIRCCPLHCLSALFAALTCQALEARINNPIIRHSVLKDLKICHAAIKEYETVFPVANWVSRMFTKITASLPQDLSSTPTAAHQAEAHEILSYSTIPQGLNPMFPMVSPSPIFEESALQPDQSMDRSGNNLDLLTEAIRASPSLQPTSGPQTPSAFAETINMFDMHSQLLDTDQSLFNPFLGLDNFEGLSWPPVP